MKFELNCKTFDQCDEEQIRVTHFSMRPVTLLKKRLWHRCFPVNFAKFLRTPFLAEHLWWLLL